MASVHTRSTLQNVNVEVYRAMAPAQGFHPEADWVTERTGTFLTRDDQFISLREQAGLNEFMRGVANDIRRDHSGLCPSEVLYKEASRRMKIAIRKVAGKKGTGDGNMLSKAEIGRIANPLLRAMVERATETRTAPEAASAPIWGGNTSTAGSSRGEHGPFYYGHMPPDGPVYDDSPSMGPDGPNRRVGRDTGPDSTTCEPGCGRGGDDTLYIAGYPLI